MTTRAALNILGSDGSLIDVTSLGIEQLSTSHPDTGVYVIDGTLGMAPPPLGWGYVVNQMDSDKTISTDFADGLLTVSVTKDEEPANLLHSITLHVSVEELPPAVMPEPQPPTPPQPVDQQQAANEEYSRRRAIADYAIAPLQDAVDVDDATDEGLAWLKLWKKYRIALGKVVDQPGYPDVIDWPLPPA
ncbi:tail fiber assembly protein [Pseudomonas iridis]|uniref:tail fiber assembly protein n=1 Tax=Pseudomonas iridis TaxID=2710587 RepID=UPI0037CBB185